MIRKLSSGKYRLDSRKLDQKTRKRRNLGTFGSLAAARRHERAIQYYKRSGQSPDDVLNTNLAQLVNEVEKLGGTRNGFYKMLDPALYVLPHDGEANLFRYSIRDDSWKVTTIPFFNVDDGGLAWMPDAPSAIYFIEGQNGVRFARLRTSAPFVAVSGTAMPAPASAAMTAIGSASR